jgi:hypothetical protein
MTEIEKDSEKREKGEKKERKREKEGEKYCYKKNFYRKEREQE